MTTIMVERQIEEEKKTETYTYIPGLEVWNRNCPIDGACHQFRDSTGFLLSIEENCCRIASNVCQSFRWTCSWQNSVSSGLKNSKVVILMWETKIVEKHWKVRKLGSEGCYLLWAAKTWWNCQHESLPTANDRFESSITSKTTELSKKVT